ncbi:unknown [Prevotella sp. CAG:891]|jgi:hypothetical protein|nr:unknown [Prevotella sp. CAG:891]
MSLSVTDANCRQYRYGFFLWAAQCRLGKFVTGYNSVCICEVTLNAEKTKNIGIKMKHESRIFISDDG